MAADPGGAFPELVRTLQDGVFSGVRRLTQTREDAEEVTQETFVRLYQVLRDAEPAWIGSLQLRAYTWTIALNLCRNLARTRSRRPRTVPLEVDVSCRDAEPVAFLLDGLPDAQRRAVVLRHVAGLSYEEIATATGRPAGTVKADVHRGLERLRKEAG